MKHNTLKALPAALLLAFSHASALAETMLDPVVVTANRVARTADETLAAVTVITRQDIERQQATSVPELLRAQPGLQFANNGGPGKATSVMLRGTSDGHTLILIDGVKVGSATNGASSLQDLPLDVIDRIEIVRGPRASLYGSEAIGGVIQIFTRRGPQPASLRLTGGSRQSFEGAVSGGIGSRDAWLNLGLSGASTRGIHVRDGGNEPDRDGYQRQNASVRAGGRIGEAITLDAQLLRNEGHNQYDGNPNETDFEQNVYAGNLHFSPNERYSSSLRLAQSEDNSRNLKDGNFSSRFNTRRSQASWQHDLSLSDQQQIVGGLDYQYDEVAMANTSGGAYAKNNRINQAAFAQYLGEFGAFDLQVAGRHDDNEQFGRHNTGSAALGYSFSPALRLRASHGTAFKAPTFNDLYWPGAKSEDLNPEKSRSSEIGASGKLGNFGWEATVFRTDVKNLIAWAPVSPSSSVWKPSNVSQARIKGLELGATQTLGNTRLAANASFLDPKDRGDNSGKLLVRRARQSARFDVDHDFGRWSLGASLRAVGLRYDKPGNTDKLGGYTTTDLRGEYEINPEWRLQARVENLFDKRYQTANGYNQEGFGAFLTLRYQAKP